MLSESRTGREAFSLVAVGSVARPTTLTLAVLTTGLISGFFYAYACSVTLGLALLPDEQYIDAMQAINATVRNGSLPSVSSSRLVPPSGARSSYSAVAVAPLPVSGGCRVLYIGGGIMVTFLINVPMNEELARVGEAAPTALSRARAEYEGPWNFWNGVRTLFSSLAFLALIVACLSRERAS